jgi:hypothetical protein
METNEIMTNAEDIMDVTEEVTTCGGSKTLKIAGVVTGATLIGVAAYKYAIKPLCAKLKAKHEAKRASKAAIYSGRFPWGEENDIIDLDGLKMLKRKLSK